MELESVETCFNCGRAINPDKDHFVRLVTFQDGMNIETVSFHITCWKEYFNERTNQKLEFAKKKSIGIVRKILGIEDGRIKS